MGDAQRFNTGQVVINVNNYTTLFQNQYVLFRHNDHGGDN